MLDPSIGIIFFLILLPFVILHGIVSSILTYINILCLIIVIRSVILNIKNIKKLGYFGILNVICGVIRVGWFYKLYTAYAVYCTEASGIVGLIDGAISFGVMIIAGVIPFVATECISFFASVGSSPDSDIVSADVAKINTISALVFCLVAVGLLAFGSFPIL